jgi:hypothetical protein
MVKRNMENEMGNSNFEGEFCGKLNKDGVLIIVRDGEVKSSYWIEYESRWVDLPILSYDNFRDMCMKLGNDIETIQIAREKWESIQS